jgi:hypothetical protein
VEVSRLNEARLVADSAMSAQNLGAVRLVASIVRERDRYHGAFAAEQRSPPNRRDFPARADEPLAVLAIGPQTAPQVVDGSLEIARSRGDVRAIAPFIAPAVGAAYKPLRDMGGLIRPREPRPPGGSPQSRP